MDDTEEKAPPPDRAEDRRRARLAEALRENLRRRKMQGRARAAADPEAREDP